MSWELSEKNLKGYFWIFNQTCLFLKKHPKKNFYMDTYWWYCVFKDVPYNGDFLWLSIFRGLENLQKL